jgi:predicted phosphodiesterase
MTTSSATQLRVALFSDVHGNGVAFRAMLADFGEREVDAFVCLGDHAQGGPEPAECLELLRELDCPAVYGNSDHFLLTLDPGEEAVTEAQIENAKWSQSQLSDELLAFHRSFPPSAEIDLGDGRSLLAFHATPRSREELVSPWMEEEEFRAPFDGLDATVFAGGHSHQQWARRLGDAYYVNPGSVGLPVDHLQSGPTRAEVAAEYAVLTVDKGVGVEFRRVPFDVDELRRSIEESGMPNPEEATGPWSHLRSSTITRSSPT